MSFETGAAGPKKHAADNAAPPLVLQDSRDYLPLNSYAPACVIVGVDASTGVDSQTDTLLVVLRITGSGGSVMRGGMVIGRGSCRERVCVFGLFLGGDYLLKIYNI